MKSIVPIAILALVFTPAGFVTAAQPAFSSPTPLDERVCHGEKISNAVLDAELSPVTILVNDSGREKVAFELTLTNKTAEPMEIDWNETYFLDHGKENGGVAPERLSPKGGTGPASAAFPPKESLAARTLVPAGSTISRRIWPMALTYYAGPSLGWFRIPMPHGEEEGISLALKVEGYQGKTERLALDLCGFNESTG